MKELKNSSSEMVRKHKQTATQHGRRQAGIKELLPKQFIDFLVGSPGRQTQSPGEPVRRSEEISQMAADFIEKAGGSLRT